MRDPRAGPSCRGSAAGSCGRGARRCSPAVATSRGRPATGRSGRRCRPAGTSTGPGGAGSFGSCRPSSVRATRTCSRSGCRTRCSPCTSRAYGSSPSGWSYSVLGCGSSAPSDADRALRRAGSRRASSRSGTAWRPPPPGRCVRGRTGHAAAGRLERAAGRCRTGARTTRHRPFVVLDREAERRRLVRLAAHAGVEPGGRLRDVLARAGRRASPSVVRARAVFRERAADLEGGLTDVDGLLARSRAAGHAWSAPADARSDASVSTRLPPAATHSCSLAIQASFCSALNAPSRPRRRAASR